MVLLEKLIVAAQVGNKFPAFYGTPRLITVFTRATTGPYPEPDESSPHPLTLFLEINFNIILPSTTRSYVI
jgi:hypothetical protein